MIWLLDTNVVSELWKPRPNSAAVGWVQENMDDCALSEITFSELCYGVHRLPFGKRRSELMRHISRDCGGGARAWSLTVVTRDTGHFPFVSTHNPFFVKG